MSGTKHEDSRRRFLATAAAAAGAAVLPFAKPGTHTIHRRCHQSTCFAGLRRRHGTGLRRARQWGRHATAFVGRRHFDDADLMEKRFEFDALTLEP